MKIAFLISGPTKLIEGVSMVSTQKQDPACKDCIAHFSALKLPWYGKFDSDRVVVALSSAWLELCLIFYMPICLAFCTRFHLSCVSHYFVTLPEMHLLLLTVHLLISLMLDRLAVVWRVASSCLPKLHVLHGKKLDIVQSRLDIPHLPDYNKTKATKHRLHGYTSSEAGLFPVRRDSEPLTPLMDLLRSRPQRPCDSVIHERKNAGINPPDCGPM